MTSEDVLNDLTAEDLELEKQLIIEKFKKLKGVAEKTALKFIDAGFHSLEQIAIADPRDFSERTGLSDKSSKQVISDAGALMDIGKPQTLAEIMEEEREEKERGYLTTGSRELDQLLDGGLHPKLITEVQALNGVGKTQMCFTEAVWATQPKENGGLGGHVVYIDAEHTFRAGRVAEICKALEIDTASVIDKIIVIRADTSAQQIKVMDEVNRIAGSHPVRLLIIDSVISHFRNEYIGRGALNERQQLLNRYLGVLHNFAIANDAVVLITNQMMDSPDGFGYGPAHVAVGGNVLGHACPYRIQLRKGQGEKRVARLVKAPDLPGGEVVVKVTEKGITDEKKRDSE